MNIRSTNKVKIEGGMSSMTDLVFLLLIFFIVLSTMVTTGHDVNVPSGKGTSKQKSNIKVFVTKDNEYFIGANSEDPVSIEDLESSIMAELKNDSVIEVMGDELSNMKHFAKVLSIAKKNKLSLVVKTKSN
jgi:biopolymer transport protein ExbD